MNVFSNDTIMILEGEGVRFSLQQIYHNQTGFESLARLHAQAKECFFDDAEIDMEKTSWFDADMCAVFGAILYNLGKNLNTVTLVNLDSEVENVLSKNGFLSHYGRVKIPDSWGTTISYQRFDVKDDHYFSGYIEDEFMRRPDMPNISPGLLKKSVGTFSRYSTTRSIIRARNWGFSVADSFFPARDQLNFTVVELGVGICQTVRDHVGYDLSPEEAIDWGPRTAIRPSAEVFRAD